MSFKKSVLLILSLILLSSPASAENSERKKIIKYEQKFVTTSGEKTAHNPANLPSSKNYLDVNDVIFPDSKWSSNLTMLIELGPEYLDKDLKLDIDPPPANDSLQTRYELHYLKLAKDMRSEEIIAQIFQQNTYMEVIKELQGKYPHTRYFITKTFGDVSYFILREKQRFKRARPTQLDSTLTTVIPIPHHSSYPSGHGGQSFWAAYVLGRLDPENKEKYYDYAFEIGHNREIAGVHYPSDTLAGQILVMQLFDKFMEVDELKEIYRNAQQEWAIIE